jgi:hypothetical protein
MAKTAGLVAAMGVAMLVAFAVVPTLTGVASAAPALTPASTSAAEQWAYGGEGWSNTTLQYGNSTATWDSSFGWTVIFTVTNESTPGTFLIEEQRTVGVTIAATYSGPALTATYNYHADEQDVAFATLTNASVVYVNGAAVPALGLENESVSITGALAESIAVTVGSHTRSASLNVNGLAAGQVSFAPSLGLIPLNLSGVNQWNSSATAAGSAFWNTSYLWQEQGYNGTTGSGSGTFAGNWTQSGTVSLTGYKLEIVPVFTDHKSRIAIELIVQGPFDSYDGFVLVPHAFDPFGASAKQYDSMSFGSASITSAETLYLSQGPHGLEITAAQTTFGSDDSAIDAEATPMSASGPAAAESGPSATVVGQPMSVPAAQAESNCLTTGCAAPAAGLNGLLLVGLVGLVVVAVVGTIGVIEWRSYARRRSQKGLVGGYGESWTNGVPPAASVPASVQAPSAPMSGPPAPEDPNRPH